MGHRVIFFFLNQFISLHYVILSGKNEEIRRMYIYEIETYYLKKIYSFIHLILYILINRKIKIILLQIINLYINISSFYISIG